VAGTYTLALNMDGTAGQCTLPIPDPPATNGMAGLCWLGANYTLALTTIDSCPPVVCNATACRGMSCTPIPGRFQMKLTINGLPAQVGLDVSLDGNKLMSESIAPKLTTTEPNGQGCGQCTNGSSTLSVTGG
jgi:hypothetical protein